MYIGVYSVQCKVGCTLYWGMTCLWATAIISADTMHYCTVQCIGLQYTKQHHKRVENWVVLLGTAQVLHNHFGAGGGEGAWQAKILQLIRTFLVRAEGGSKALRYYTVN